jgi:hypothetical protein
LNELFEEENPISNPFEHVSTKYQQNAYYEEHFGLVGSQAFIATLLFDPSMSDLPIIAKQNSPSVGLFTRQYGT